MSEIAPLPKPPPNPTVGDIPQASALHQQLSTLNHAIYLLNAGGAKVINLSIVPPQDIGGMITVVSLDPPITNPQTLADLSAALEQQAVVIAQQLTAMGYSAAEARKIRRE